MSFPLPISLRNPDVRGASPDPSLTGFPADCFPSPTRNDPVLDVVMLVLIVALFGLSWGFVRLCEKL
ncbi:MAG: hypothetical protein ABJC74_14870 [Gemmatimonadota bacterium]